MTTDTIAITLINGLAVDEDGVIHDLPPGADAMEAVMESLVLCDRNIAGWEQKKALLRKALEKHMSREGLKRLETKWGRAVQVEPGVSEFGKPEEIPGIVRDLELDMATELSLYQTAKTLDAKKLRAMTFHEDVLNRLIGTKMRAGFLRFDPPAEAP